MSLPHEIYTLTEAASLREYGCRTYLSQAFNRGELKGRVFNLPRRTVLVTIPALEEFKASKERRRYENDRPV